MLIDNALQNFTEKYNREAIHSIDVISNDLGLYNSRQTLTLCNINEAFNLFQKFIKGYAEYQRVYKESSEISSIEQINSDFEKSFEKFFKTENVLYNDLPKYVESYLNGIKSLTKTVDQVKSVLFENDIDHDRIAAVNNFTDTFFGKLQESFDSDMNLILGASGYNARKRFAERVTRGMPKPATFL